MTIDLPDINGRQEILAVCKKIALSEEVNLEHVARNTPGFSELTYPIYSTKVP